MSLYMLLLQCLISDFHTFSLFPSHHNFQSSFLSYFVSSFRPCQVCWRKPNFLYGYFVIQSFSVMSSKPSCSVNKWSNISSLNIEYFHYSIHLSGSLFIRFFNIWKVTFVLIAYLCSAFVYAFIRSLTFVIFDISKWRKTTAAVLYCHGWQKSED